MDEKKMKTTSLKSILAVIQLLALLQIAVSFIGPGIWKGENSDLRGNIAIGGEVAVNQFRLVEAHASKRVTAWGAGLGGAILVAATIAAILCRKPKGA